MEEIWKSLDFLGYDRHEISNYGNVRCILRPDKLLSVYVRGTDGYLEVGLPRKKWRVHRLVALAFIPNPDNKEQINHIDGDKTNPKADNLEWVTPSENIQHAWETGLCKAHHPKGFQGISNVAKGEKNAQAKLTDEQVIKIRILYSQGFSQAELSRMYDVSCTSMSNLLRGKSYKHLL